MHLMRLTEWMTGQCARHWSTEARKQVLPRFTAPPPTLGSTVGCRLVTGTCRGRDLQETVCERPIGC